MKNQTKAKLRSSSKPLQFLNYLGALVAMGVAVYCWQMDFHWALYLFLFLVCILFLINCYFIRGNQDVATKAELENKLAEKETLLKEVHHRVKNNLQTVSSLLSLQSRTVQDPFIKGIIKSSQHRVVSMSMVHEMLYKRDDYTSKIELKPYLLELCQYLIHSVKGKENNISTNVTIGDYRLSIDTVIPLGLIINETVTNALKYGIPETSEGEIKIHLSKNDSNTYELYLGDNGIGFPESINPTTSNSLGLKLIHNLARQLKGSITRDMETKGTYYHINFKEVVEDFNWVE